MTCQFQQPFKCEYILKNKVTNLLVQFVGNYLIPTLNTTVKTPW